MKKITRAVLVIYVMALFSRAVPLVSADEKWLEGKIAGTGQGKVWILIGSNHGVTEGMIFEVRRNGEVIAKIKAKKVSASSSEAEIIGIASEDVKISPGDMARWMLPPEFEEKETPRKEEPKTEPVIETTKEAVPSTTVPVETKSVPKKEETVAVTPTETKKAEQSKKTVKKKSGSIFGKKTWLYVAIAGAAAFALASGGGKSKGSSASPTAESASSSSDSAPSLPF